MKPLLQLCLDYVCCNIDLVDSLEGLPEDVLAKMCAILCQQRRLTPETLALFLQPHTMTLRLADCAGEFFCNFCSCIRCFWSYSLSAKNGICMFLTHKKKRWALLIFSALPRLHRPSMCWI